MTSELLLLLEAEEQLLPPTPQTSHPRQSTATSQLPPRLCPAAMPGSLTVHLQPQGTSAWASVSEYGKLSTGDLHNMSEENKKRGLGGDTDDNTTGPASSIAGRNEAQTREKRLRLPF